jgi:hypothetical protein
MKNVIYCLGLIFVISGFTLVPAIQINAQSYNCDWVSGSGDCDVYDCGRCIMWACGSDGGMMICDE